LTPTETVPGSAVAGTAATIVESLHEDTAAFTPPKVTRPVPWLAPKLDPVIVTDVLAGPDVGEIADTPDATGPEVTVNIVSPRNDVAILLLVTIKSPVVAPGGTIATTIVGDQLVVVALVPLKVTLPETPRFAPLMSTVAPTGPATGDKLVMAGTTTKRTLLLQTRPLLTATSEKPGGALIGTETTMVVSLQEETGAATPPKWTEPDPWVLPKDVPFIVTSVPLMPMKVPPKS